MTNLKFYSLLLIAILCSACNEKQNKNINTDIIRSPLNDYLIACESNGFNGAVLVAKGDKIILSEGYGFANKEKSVVNTPKTVFDICSVTKQFTGAAILKLAEEGKLKLTDSIDTYFEDLPLDKKNITIHQLLTHSAGFGHDIGESDFDHIPENEYFQRLFDTHLLFTPGEKYAYSNSGYSILGRIIEIASGTSYESYLSEKLFEPAGMSQTGYLMPNWRSDRIANEYLYNVIDKGNHISRYQQDEKIAWTLMANGGINSTQEDMYKWYLALKNNTVLNNASKKKLTTPHILEYEGESSYYGYGWALFQSYRDTKVITHNGYNGINYYEFVWFPEEDALILFSTNSSTQESIRIPSELEKMLFDKSYKAQPISKNKLTELLKFTESYTGNVNDMGKQLKRKFEAMLDDPFYLNRLSGIFLREDEIEKAIVIAEINTQLFPDDGNIWDTLGDVYFAVKENDKAKKSYKKALEFKPENDDCFWCDNSSSKLKSLEVRK